MAFQKGNPGKPVGATNKATRELRTFAQKYTKEAIRGLVKLARSAESEAARVGAWREVLDRAHGKSPQAVTDPDGNAIDIPAAILFAISKSPDADCRE